MSVITDEMVARFAAIMMDEKDGGVRRALNAVLPDILEEAAKVADREACDPLEGDYNTASRNIARIIRALAQDTATVQEKGR